MKQETDVFTLEIVKDSLLAISDEMFETLARTSMSPIIYEVLDYASGITDRDGNLLTQGNGVAGFIGMLSHMVEYTIQTFTHKNLHPGDVIIINDPYVGGGSHLSDVGLVMPIFVEGEIVAFVANKAHWTEVGGKDPGSFSNDATEVYQEGLQFPCIKLIDKGVVNEPLLEMIKANVRMPDLSIGDLWAQIAALKTGHKRIEELCYRYNKQVVLQSIERLLDQGEILAREEMKKLPKGTFEAVDYIDDDGFGNGPFHVKVKVTITDDQFICDFRGSHVQVPGPINCSYSALVTAVRVVFLSMTNAGDVVNDGIFRPLEVIVDKGSVLSAERPAPTSIYWESDAFGGDLVWKALAPHMKDRLGAGHFLSVCAVTLSGTRPDTEEPFLIVEPSVGGWGAANKQDGARGQFCIGDGETYNVPIEIAETNYGVMVEEYALRNDGAGAGEFIGGSGVIRSYKALSDNQQISVTFGRNKFLPWGVNGGKEGSANEFFVEKVDGTVEGPFSIYARYPLETGDVVKLCTGTGGGYGNPLHRSIEKIQSDVRNGYVTIEDAENIYGIMLHENDLSFIGVTEARQKLQK